jgi:uncharacterized protein (TIGR03435 family)
MRLPVSGPIVPQSSLRGLPRFIVAAVAIVAAGSMATPIAFAQATSQPAPSIATATATSIATSISKGLGFDVAAIKPSKDDGRWKMTFTPDGFTAINVPLRRVIQEAYGLYDESRWSGGPAWIDSEKLDINAKVDVSEAAEFDKLAMAQQRALLQQLLADRFKLAVHHETKELPVYAIRIEKSGAKLQESTPEHLHPDGFGGGLVTRSRAGVLELQGYSMPRFAALLTNFKFFGRTVEDKTGLTGYYDISLQWDPKDASSPSVSVESSGPSIFTALKEQLGLKLEPTKAPLDTIVIDHVERPSEN